MGADMIADSQEAQLSSADGQPLPPAKPDGAAQFAQDIQAVNEQLLIAALREQSLADQLRHQLAFTNAITTSLVEGVYVLDMTGRCIFVNPAAEHMLGWTSAELHGTQMSVVIPSHAALDDSRGAAPVPLQEVLRFGTVHRDDNAQFVHQGGRIFQTAYAAAPMSMDGQIIGPRSPSAT